MEYNKETADVVMLALMNLNMYGACIICQINYPNCC
jgi:hypothetical protein